MQRLELDPNKLHHAYVIVSNSTTAVEDFVSMEMKIPYRGNPDVYVGEYASIGIDDLADLTAMHQRVPMGPKKVIVISTNSITQQAQNSLLKMIEEPTANTHFFIILPTASVLLPTVLSRVHVIELDTGEIFANEKEVKEFVAADMGKRLDIVKSMMGDLEKERISKETLFQFVAGIEKMMHENKTVEAYPVVLKVNDYMRDPSSSIKMLLEYLALRLPRKM